MPEKLPEKLKIYKILIISIITLLMGGCVEEKVVTVSSTSSPSTGYLVDARVANVSYSSVSYSGVTENDGGFYYSSGETITFNIGNVELGSISSVPSDTLVTPYELVGVSRSVANASNQAVINIARFLQALDSDSLNSRITISNVTKSELNSANFDIQNSSKADLESFLNTNLGISSPPSEASVINHLNETVGIGNQTPSATFSSFSVSQDSSYSGTLTGSDADGDSLTYYIYSSPANGTVSITNSSTGAFTYTPTASYSGSDSFSYVVNDGDVNSSAQTVTVTVSSSPTSATVTKNINEDSSLVFASGDFLYSGSTASSIKIISTVSNGTLKLNGTAVTLGQEIASASIVNLQYDPTANYSGSDSFTFQASNGTTWTSTATVSITIASVNDTPVFSGDTTFIVSDGATSIAELNVTDADNDTLTFSKIGGDDNDSFTLETNGSLSFTQAIDYRNPTDLNKNNSYLLNVSISDGTSSITQSIVVYIEQPTNNAPTSSNVSFSTNEDINYSSTLTGNDTDSDSITFHRYLSPTKGDLILDSSGDYIYTPNDNTYGSDSFQFRVFDGVDFSSIYDVNITITPVNDSPLGSDFSYGEINSSAKTFNWKTLSGASDPDSDSLSATILDQGAKGVAVISGDTVTYTPLSDVNGSDEFNITISDSNSSSADLDITISVWGIDTIDANITAFYAIDEESGYTISSDEKLGIFTPSIAIKFSEEMNSSSINTTNIIVEDESSSSVGGTLTYNSTAFIAYFSFSTLPLNSDHTYTLTVQNVTDKAGNVMDTNITTFTTGKQKYVIKTGQTTMYAIEDDGYYEKGATRVYANSGLGYITSASGHMWQDDEDNNASVYTWSEANASCESNATDFTDWRLPTSAELQELINYGDDSGVMIDNGVNFYYGQSASYWSSDIDGSDAWSVSFSDGNISSEANTTTNYMRCVRDTSTVALSSPLIRDSSNNIVIDGGRYLMWQDDVNSSNTWNEAIDYCEDLSLGSYTDWRLPNIAELNTIVDLEESPKLDTAFETFAPSGSYWSSTTNPKSTTYAYDINISTGTVENHLKTGVRYVRCVRGGN